MEAALEDAWANPSSVHGPGRRARALLESARRQLAEAIGAEPADVVFTSGGTEAVNMAVLGAADGQPLCRVVTTNVEHPSMAESVAALGRAGLAVARLELTGGEPPSLAALEAAIDQADGPVLVALQWVNHEVGTCFPLAAYAELCRARGASLVVDATQALGKLPVDVAALGADAVAFASHKIGGPAGAGALWLRRGAQVGALLLGGGQERGRRPGSPDLLACVGFGGAASELPARLAAQTRIAGLRDRAQRALLAAGGVANGGDARRVATVTNVSFEDWTGEVLVAALDVEGLAVSSGAACSSGVTGRSPVLLAMHASESWRAESSLRWSFGPESTETEVDSAIEILADVVARKPG